MNQVIKNNFQGKKVLVVDDDPSLLQLLALRLRSLGLEIKKAESAEEAVALLPSYRPQLVITDLRMGEMDGMALFSHIQQQCPALPVIILTAHGTIKEAVAATHQGVFGFLTKPFDSKELLELVTKAFALNALVDHEQHIEGQASWRANIITRSAMMENLLREVERVAQSNVSVYIQGESGTGKELIAQAIHKASPRSDQAFVAVNCSAIPEDLLESELFGHYKGAFSGASAARKGLFEIADGGTLFLDEIGDMSPAFQVKLLRALQEGEIRPVGANKTIAVDVRVVSASHQDLQEMTTSNLFRLDFIIGLMWSL